MRSVMKEAERRHPAPVHCRFAIGVEMDFDGCRVPVRMYCRILAEEHGKSIKDIVRLGTVSGCSISDQFASCAIYREAGRAQSPVQDLSDTPV